MEEAADEFRVLSTVFSRVRLTADGDQCTVLVHTIAIHRDDEGPEGSIVMP